MLTIKGLILKGIKKDQYEKYIDIIPELKSEKNEKLVMITLTIIAVIILGVFAINPTLSTIASLQKQLEDSKSYESKLSEKINNLSKLDGQYSKLQASLPIIFEGVPKTTEIATLTATLQTISNTAGVKISNLQAQKAEVSKSVVNSKKYSIYNYSVSSEGSYQDLISFLDKIISFQRILTVNSVSIIKSTTPNQTTALQISITGNAFFKP